MEYLIYGAGGHARVLADLILNLNGKITAFIDDHSSSTLLNNIPVKGYDAAHLNAQIVIGIGNNKIREKIAAALLHKTAVIIHPSAIVASDAEIGEGTVILANAVIQTGARIGKHVIINANACVDHDAIVEDFVHISPNVYIGGAAVIGAGTTITAGKIIPRMTKIDCNKEI
jgi:sugar O-acyltransferase (sialic acid O-acetyltransferase NeuD family)